MNVSLINYVYKEFVNQHATTIQPVLISNTVKIMYVRKRFDAAPTMIVYSMNVARSIRMADLNVKMLARDDSCVDVMLNVRLEIMMVSVHVNKVLLMMDKVDVVELNANVTVNAVQRNTVKRISVNWSVKVVDPAVKKLYVR